MAGSSGRKRLELEIDGFPKGAVVLTVRVTRRFRLRVWLANWILRLGCMIGGIGYKEETQEEQCDAD